ncbi:hypothetical protein HER10_EVM0008734 [Colletotrichum scovillei]|uniref:uncharacterized protein n=1 Tax=Colletotrichum scovillei TaxID=1209932 RepID=UPI0015C3150B|nr:uncharacterized protein HER10_EVM0008734 [Colletotrichum scovillei]KAF4781212.1 hypothetical protein HER10_EVM0008734 [Colletotrichum scovillei]
MTTIRAMVTERQANDFMAVHDDITAWQDIRNQYRISGKEVSPAIAALTSWIETQLEEAIGAIYDGKLEKARVYGNRMRYGIRAFEQFTREEALYGGLVMELRQILRDHDLMEDLRCSAEQLPVLCAKYDVKRITPQEIQDAQDQQGWRVATNWSDLIQDVDRERCRSAEWNRCYGRYEGRGWRSTPFECPPKPKTPFSNVARAVIDLCLEEVNEEDNWESVVDIVREHCRHRYNLVYSITRITERKRHDGKFLQKPITWLGDARLRLLGSRRLTI